MSGLTEELARFIAAAGSMALPDKAVDIAKMGFVDTAATMLAGADEAVLDILDRTCSGGEVEASVLFGRRRASVDEAILINGTAAHVLDYDDVALLGHPSAVLVPAVLAEAERLGLSGEHAVRAYITGYEVWAELSRREPDPLHVKGWHPTTVFGTIGSAAAIAMLNGLDATRARNALGIAASLSSGVVANFGSMTKPFQVGHAAARGRYAVTLAKAGLTASPDALEHYAGLLAALSPKGRVDRDSPAKDLGQRFKILENGLSIKKYPICYATHRAIDGLIDLAKANDIVPADVERVTVTFSPTQASILRNHDPRTALEAKFSIEFAVAAALVDRSVGFAQLTDAFVSRADVRRLFRVVEIETVDTDSPGEVGLAFEEKVMVQMVDGRQHRSGNIRHARGNAKLPLSQEDLAAKFLDCARNVDWLDPSILLTNLRQLERLETVERLAH